jgi:uncharacterized membrane protein
MEPIDQALQSERLERLSAPLAHLVREALDRAPAIRQFLRGGWLGHPLHPVLTDVPLGAWTAALVLDATTNGDEEGYGRAADNTILVGLAGALSAAVTGLTDWSTTDGEARRLGLIHGLTNITATSLFVLALSKRRQDRSARRRFAALGYAVALAGAYLGGHLVFRKEIGVDPRGPMAAESALQHG